MNPDYKETMAEVQAQYPGLFEYLRNYIKSSLAILKNPKQLLPTIVLGVIWLVLGIVGADFRSLPLPLWILSFLTYAQGGLYGGLLSAVGGIVGKVVVAAFLNAMIVPLFSGQKPFSGVTGAVSGIFRGSALQGLRDASPLTGGAGAALVLYGIMNSRQDMQEAMVGIVAIIMLLKNLGTKGGFMTGLLFSAAKTFSGGRIPSQITVERMISGMTIGFTLAVALAMLPFRPCIWLGMILLVVSIILSFLGKNKVNPTSGNNPMPPQNNRTNYGPGMGNAPGRNGGSGRMNMILLLFASGIIMLIIVAAGSVNAYAEQWVDPWEQFEVKNTEELFQCLKTDPVEEIRVVPSVWKKDDPSKEKKSIEGSNSVIHLTKGEESQVEVRFQSSDLNGTRSYKLIYTFCGDPSEPFLLKARLDLTSYEGSWDDTVLSEEGFDNIDISLQDSNDSELARGILLDTYTDFTLMFSVVGVYGEGLFRKGNKPIDLKKYIDDPDRYTIDIRSYNIENRHPDYGSDRSVRESLGIKYADDVFGALSYSVIDKQNKNREIVSQDCYYYRYHPEIMNTELPAGASYPQWEYKEYWSGNFEYGFNPKGKIKVSVDDHTPKVSEVPGEAASSMSVRQVQLRYDKETGEPVNTVNLDSSAGWGISYQDYCESSLYGVVHYHPEKGETWDQEKARDRREREEYHLKKRSLKEGEIQNTEEFEIGDNARVFKISKYKEGEKEKDELGYTYKSKHRSWNDFYLITIEYPELPLCQWPAYLLIDGYYSWRKPVGSKVTIDVPDVEAFVAPLQGYKNSIPKKLLNAIVDEPLNIYWFDPVWADGYDPDTGEPIGNKGSEGAESRETSKNAGSIGGSMVGNIIGDGLGEKDAGSYSALEEERQDANAGGDSSPFVFNDPGSYDLLNENVRDNDNHEYLWDHHVGPMDTTLRTLISFVLSIIFAGGVSGTLGGGVGGAIGGAAGGFPGGPSGDGGWPGDAGPYGDVNSQPGAFENQGGLPGGQNPGEVQQKDPYHWDNPMPKGWKVDSEGDISYKDPATGERMKYILTGYDPNTGEPQYLSEKSGFTFGQSTLRENYDDRSRNAGTLSQDYETGKRWQQEQHQQNQAKWDQERVTGKTDMSEAWKRDQQQMSKEQYLEKLAEKYNKDVNDLKDIKKEIIKNRVEAETEQQAQMAREAWLEFGEKTASQIESVADTSINVLGEVTGPAGKTIKNIYTFAKPGMSKLAEAGAKGKDVYETMTMIAQGTAEGAIGVLQNEVDGFGMAIGGDLVKTGLDGVVNGKSMDEIAADLTQTAYQSSINYGVGQMISSAGKKASQKITAGKTMEVGKNIDSYGEFGVSWKNMAVDKANQNMAKLRLDSYKKMTAQITRMENWISAATNLFSDVYQKNLTGEISEAVGETAKAEMQSFLNNSGEMIRRYKNGQNLDD